MGGEGVGCISLLASWTLLTMVVEALIGNIHSGNRAHWHHTHKTRRNPFDARNTNFFASTGTSKTGRTTIFNIIPVALLLGQGGEYFTPFFSPFPRESEGERVRE